MLIRPTSVMIRQQFIQATPRFSGHDPPIVYTRALSPLVECFCQVEVASTERKLLYDQRQRTIQCSVSHSLLESLHWPEETTLVVHGVTQWSIRTDRGDFRSEIPDEFFTGLLPLRLEKIGAFWLVNGVHWQALFEFLKQWTSQRTPIVEQLQQKNADTPFLHMIYRMCNWLIDNYDLAEARELLEQEPSPGTRTFLLTVLNIWGSSVFEVFAPEANYWLFQQQVAEHYPTLRIYYSMFDHPQAPSYRYRSSGCLVPTQINRFLFRNHPFRALAHLLHQVDENKTMHFFHTDTNPSERSFHRWLAACLGLLEFNCPVELYETGKPPPEGVSYFLMVDFLV